MRVTPEHENPHVLCGELFIFSNRNDTIFAENETEDSNSSVMLKISEIEPPFGEGSFFSNNAYAVSSQRRDQC